jgi:hypothetical protein
MQHPSSGRVKWNAAPLSVRMMCPVSVATVLFFLVAPAAVLAGTICGTVRDASSGFPISHAGVFLRETSGVYTGLHAASDSSGAYCIDGIPAGVYDLEYRVDSYLVDYVRDVAVNDEQVAINVDLVAPRWHLVAWPNPSSRRVFLEFSTSTSGPVRMEVFDVRGRRVRGWEGSGGENTTMSWNFRDAAGRLVPAGVYFARLSDGRKTRVTRILRIP